jgi:hypothetical protein
MSDAEHDRVARLLHEQGQAEAPPELAEHVMAQVRRESHTAPARRRVNWRPVAAWTAVAAVLLAVGFGIATRAPGGSSSSSGSAAAIEAGAGGSTAAPAGRPTDSAADAYTVDRSAAEKILANHVPAQLSTGSTSAARAITLNPAQWDEVRAALAKAAARDPHPENPVVVRLRPE